MNGGGKREGSGRKPTYAENMPSVKVTARHRDFEILRMLGHGNISAGVRRLVDERRRNGTVTHQLQADETLIKQVTIFTHPSRPINGEDMSNYPQRYHVAVHVLDDATEAAFDTIDEATAYAQDVITRDLKPWSLTTMLDER